MKSRHRRHHNVKREHNDYYIMQDPLDFESRPLFSRLARKRRIAGLVILLENLAAATWRLLFWAALFWGIWLMNLPALFGKAGFITIWLIFFGGLYYLAKKDLKHLRWPHRKLIDRRLEEVSGLMHRPLGTLEDRLANPQKIPTRQLWHDRQKEAAKTLSRLKTPYPRPALAQRDPVALRFIALLCLVAGLIIAGPQAPARLHNGLFPFTALIAPAEKARDKITFWITPPDYTGIGQTTLQGAGTLEEIIPVPEGSTIKARVQGGFFAPTLEIGAQKHELRKLDDQSWGWEQKIAAPARAAPSDNKSNSDKHRAAAAILRINQFPWTRLEAPYQYLRDTAPEIARTKDTEITKNNVAALTIPLTVKDDYSVTKLHMEMTLAPAADDIPLGTPVTKTQHVMSPPQTETDIEPVFDLAWHPWAGLPVIINISAEDHPGHKSTLPPIQTILPQRDFEHPVAQKLIEMRRRLIWNPNETSENIAFALEDLLYHPEAFQHDPVVFLSLRSASTRLYLNQSDRAQIKAVIAQIWDTALRIEDGNLSLAARDLKQARQKLAELLADPEATQEEIGQAMQELRQAMSDYFRELYRELQKRAADDQNRMPLSPEMFDENITPEDFAAFMDQMQSEALSGNRDNARQMLSQLEQMMNNFDSAMNFEMPPDMQFMQEGINELKELIEKQQALLDQTQSLLPQEQPSGGLPQTPLTYPDFLQMEEDIWQQWGQGTMPPPPAAKQPPASRQQPGDQKKPYDTTANSEEQEALRYILGQLMLETGDTLGEIPQNMQNAELEMRGAADNLAENNPKDAIPHQQKAVDELQNSMNQMQQQMQQRMKQMKMMTFGGGSGQWDPLGRPVNPDGKGRSLMPGGQVEVPNESERRRVQEILRTLRQRSGERHRPDYELDYFHRLMRQF